MAQPISYGSDYDADFASIMRRQKYAELMQQQSMQPVEQQTAGGWVVPNSWTQGLAKAVQGVAGAYGEKKSLDETKALSQKYRDDLSNTIRQSNEAYLGKPAQSFQTPANEMGDAAAMQNVPAKPSDPMQAAAIMMQHPATQAMGMQMQMKAMDEAKRKALIQQIMGGAQPGQPTQPGQPGQLPQGGATNALGIPGNVAALMTSGDSELAALGKAILESSKGVAARPGAPVVNPFTGAIIAQPAPAVTPGMQLNMGPNGNTASPIPGFAQGAASTAGAITGANEDAKAQRDMVTVNTPQGPRMMSRAQALQLSQGGQQQPQAWLGPEPKGAFQGDPEVIAQQINAIKDPQERAGAMRAFNNQMAGGGKPSALPGIGLQSEAGKAYETKRGAEFAKQAADFADQGAKASSMGRQLNDLERIYADPNIAKGAVAENISGLKNLASSFGVDIQGLGGEQAVSAITNKMALDLRSTGEGGGMPGAMSDADRNFLANMTPNLSKSPDGRKQIISTMRKVAQRQTEIAKMATQYEQEHGTIDVGFQKQVQDYANSNQLFESAPRRRASDSTPVKKFNQQTGRIE